MSERDEAVLVAGVLDGRRLNDGYDRVTVTADGDYLELRIHVKLQDEYFGLRIPGPRSTAPQPWLYIEPDDVSHWASMLAIWFDESLTAGAAHLATEQRNGVRYLFAVSYGLRVADEAEHVRWVELARG